MKKFDAEIIVLTKSMREVSSKSFLLPRFILIYCDQHIKLDRAGLSSLSILSS